MAHAVTNDESFADPEMSESLRIIRHQRSLKLIAVAVALVAAIAGAIAYASLSYSDRSEAVPTHAR